jgi:hypothetical protein
MEYMDMKQQNVLSAKELRTLQICCVACNTAVVFDCSRDDTKVPTQCPSCGVAFGSLVVDYITGFRRWHIGTSKIMEFTFTLLVD